MGFSNREVANEYISIRYHTTNFFKACQQHIVKNGLLHKGLSQEEIQEKIKEYKANYIQKKKKKANREAIEEARRRHEFIHGRACVCNIHRPKMTLLSNQCLDS